MKGILVTMVMSMFLLSYVSPLISVLHHEIALVQLGLLCFRVFPDKSAFASHKCSNQQIVVTVLQIEIDDITQTFNLLLKGFYNHQISTDCSALTNTLVEHKCSYCDCSEPVFKDSSSFLVHISVAVYSPPL